MSGGERRSLNLSVAHSFAYVMMLSCGCNPSILWLDEVSSNIDSVGIEGIYNMIRELAKEKQVFITTHNQHLLELLNGCDKMQLEKRDGLTKLLN
jgi:ABC-type multidrug transport system ATPase subunit